MSRFPEDARPPGLALPPDADIEMAASRAKLLSVFGSSTDLVFVRAWGNIGDDLIYAGTRQLLSTFEHREVSIRNLQDVSGHTALVSGSGGWCRSFHEMPAYMPTLEERFKSVIVLPSTFDPSEPSVRTALERSKALFFARDLVSYEKIRTLCRADVAYDCAFCFDFAPYKKNGTGVLNAFRSDGHSLDRPLPDNNVDISRTCSDLDEWLWTIARFELVRTDRAHVMIAAAMLGKRVEYDITNYHKVPALAEFSLKGFPVSRIAQATVSRTLPAGREGAGARIGGAPGTKPMPRGILKFSEYLAERYSSPGVVIFDDIQSLESQIPEDAIAVVREGISAIRRSPQMLEAVRRALRKARKLLLVDDANADLDLHELEAYLAAHGVPPEFLGRINQANRRVGSLALFSSSALSERSNAPSDFRVVALISTYNEADVIVPVMQYLVGQGVDIYLIDNWSTDGTYEMAKAVLGMGLVGLERWPAAGPSGIHRWEALLVRKEELSRELKADWFMHYDADEIRQSPWKGMRLRDAVFRVQQEGFNAIDFTLLNFVPIDESYLPGSSLLAHFKFAEFSRHPAHFLQIRAWKKTDQPVNLWDSGGHDAHFPGRRVYPYKFLLRHYPIRSQAHGERKVFHERRPRYDSEMRRRGWHNQYDAYTRGSSFIKSPAELMAIDDDFYANFLVERLSGIGIVEEAAPGTRSRRGERASVGLEERSSQAIAKRLRQNQEQLRLLAARVKRQEAELQGIYASRAWKLAGFMRRLRALVAPSRSWRERLRHAFHRRSAR